MFGRKKLDFVAVGEVTMDAFIRLKDASVNCNVDKENCKLCVDFGAKIPFEFAVEIPAVGNAANASVSASRLGLSSALVANIGKDKNGEACVASLKKDGVVTDFVRVQKDKETNYHYILWYEDDRTILQKHSTFEYALPNIGNPRWIYLTSLGEKSLALHNDIVTFLESHPDTKLAFQPGIFQIKMGREQLQAIYKKTDVFICNKEEAAKILGITNTEIKTLLAEVAKLGPKNVVITDGPEGAYFFDGAKSYFMPPYPDPKPPFERTGAGDAYASTFVSALALGKTPEEALQWAGINSMSVVQEIGAQKGLLAQSDIKRYNESSPAGYKLQNI